MTELQAYLPWIISGSLIILVLTAIAGRLLWLLYRQQREEKVRASQPTVQFHEAAESQREQGIAALQSIRILASSYLEGQVGAAEVSLRIAALQQHRDVSEACREQAGVFVELAGKLAHIPSHQAWKDLSRAERDDFRAQMAVLEGEYKTRLAEAAQRLRVH